jgi:hypothetical protein
MYQTLSQLYVALLVITHSALVIAIFLLRPSLRVLPKAQSRPAVSQNELKYTYNEGPSRVFGAGPSISTVRCMSRFRHFLSALDKVRNALEGLRAAGMASQALHCRTRINAPGHPVGLAV